MKKFLVAISVLVLGVVLVACTKEKKFQVDVFIYNYADSYIGGVRQELEVMLKKEDNISFNFHDAGADQAAQTTSITNAIVRGTDLLVVNIVEPASADQVVKQAKDAKVPLLFFNREVTDAAVKSYPGTAFIGTDPDEAGYMQGQMAAEMILKDYDKYDRNNDGKINYVMIRADLDNPEANGRTTYSVQEMNRLLKAAGKPELVQIGTNEVASWDTAIAKTKFDAIKIAGTNLADIDIVFANNDDMALGVVKSLQESDLNKGGTSPAIPVFGVDALATAVNAIDKGEMAGTVKQDGTAMAEAIHSSIVNKSLGNEYLHGTDYKYQTDVNKLRIPYAIYIK